MRTSQTVIKEVIASVLLCLYAPMVLGAIDIAPEQLHFDAVLLGSSAQKTITITTDSDDLLWVEPSVSGDASNSVLVLANTPLAIKKDIPLQIVIMAEGKALGLTEGNLDIYFSKPHATLTSASDTFVQIPLAVSVVSQGKRQLFVKDSSVSNTEVSGVATFSITFENAGSVDIEPSIIITIDQSSAQHFIAKISALDSRTLQYPLLTTNLAIGMHEANIVVKDNAITILDRSVSFLVEPPNSYTKQGDIVDVIVPQPTMGNEVTGGVVFKNSGQEPLMVTIKTDVTKDKSVISHSEETYFIPSAQTQMAPVHFTPKTDGTYQISSQAFFAGTVTDVTQRTLELNTSHEESIDGLAYAAVIIFVASVLLITSYKKRFHHTKKGGQLLNEELENNRQKQFR